MSRADDVAKLQLKIADLKTRLAAAERQLTDEQSICRHTWSAPKYTPIRHAGYEYEDHQGWRPVTRYMASREEPLWTRVCALCLKSETTAKTAESIVKAPDFGASSR